MAISILKELPFSAASYLIILIMVKLFLDNHGNKTKNKYKDILVLKEEIKLWLVKSYLYEK